MPTVNCNRPREKENAVGIKVQKVSIQKVRLAFLPKD